MNGDDRLQIDLVHAEIREVGAKVDLLLERDRISQNTTRDFENRIRKLEKWKFAIPASVLMATAAFFGAILGK